MKTTYCKSAWIIDDEELSIFYTENLLLLNGFSSEVRSFNSAREALSELEDLIEPKAFPDFIFLDLNMPALDGWEFLQFYRNFPTKVKEKCIIYVLSSSVDEEDINRSKLHKDVRDFLIKPLSKNDIEVIKFQNE